jgi:fatty-acyl-CoA synthase
MDQWYRDCLEARNWAGQLDRAANRFGDKTYLVSGGQRLTFRQFQKQVTDLAKALLELGVKKGDVVAIWMNNRLEWALIQYAAYKAGAVMTPIYTHFTQPEVEYSLKQADVKVLFMSNAFLGGKIDAGAMATQLCPELESADPHHFRSERFPKLRHVICVGDGPLPAQHRWEDLLDRGAGLALDEELATAQAAVGPFDVANIMFTSGTTGFPKGGLSMHITNLCGFSLSAQRLGLGEDSVILHNYPMFTNAGIWVTSMGLTTGCEVVLLGDAYRDAAAALEAIEAHHVTHAAGTATHYIDYFSHADLSRRDLSSWKFAFCASPAGNAFIQEKAQKLGLILQNGYGVSECGGMAVQTLVTDSLRAGNETIGLPLPSVRLRIVDPDTHEPVRPGTPGEAWLHDVYPGSCVGKGYYKMPEQTAAVITEDGWFKTGDLLVEDDDGYLHFVGRHKDMLKVGGFNVYPAEVEEVLARHPKVAEAIVIGVPDPRLAEIPVAWILPREGGDLTADEVISFARENLAAYKVPKHVRFYESGELPVTTNLKVRKVQLQEISVRELGL